MIKCLLLFVMTCLYCLPCIFTIANNFVRCPWVLWKHSSNGTKLVVYHSWTWFRTCSPSLRQISGWNRGGSMPNVVWGVGLIKFTLCDPGMIRWRFREKSGSHCFQKILLFGYSIQTWERNPPCSCTERPIQNPIQWGSLVKMLLFDNNVFLYKMY